MESYMIIIRVLATWLDRECTNNAGSLRLQLVIE